MMRLSTSIFAALATFVAIEVAFSLLRVTFTQHAIRWIRQHTRRDHIPWYVSVYSRWFW
jgi:hypothetical protein